MTYALVQSNLSTSGSWRPVWRYQTSVASAAGKNIAPASVGAGLAYVGGTNTAIGGHSCYGSVRAVNTANWTRSGWGFTWQDCLPGYVRAGVTYSNGLVVAAADAINNYSANLYVLNAATGVILSNVTLNQTVNGEPIVSDGRIIVATGNWTWKGKGYVDAFGIPIGTGNSAMRPHYGWAPTLGLAGVNTWGNASGGIPTYNLTWTSGNGQVSYSRMATFAYGANGGYFANLSIKDAAGEVSTFTWKVYAHNSLCNNQTFQFCSVTAVIPCYLNSLSCFLNTVLPITFGGIVTQGLTGVTWSWNFGDGSPPSSALDPTHLYSGHGTYTVTVTATNSEQVQTSQQFQVTV